MAVSLCAFRFLNMDTPKDHDHANEDDQKTEPQWCVVERPTKDVGVIKATDPTPQIRVAVKVKNETNHTGNHPKRERDGMEDPFVFHQSIFLHGVPHHKDKVYREDTVVDKAGAPELDDESLQSTGCCVAGCPFNVWCSGWDGPCGAKENDGQDGIHAAETEKDPVVEPLLLRLVTEDVQHNQETGQRRQHPTELWYKRERKSLRIAEGGHGVRTLCRDGLCAV